MPKYNRIRRKYSWLSSKISVARSGKKGHGVYAKRVINKNEVVAVAGGFIMTLAEMKKLSPFLRSLAYNVEENLFIGVKQAEDNWMFNHSCEPNLLQRGQLSLIAARKILPGEELTFDYGTVMYRPPGQPKHKMICRCGATNCRRVITDEDWRLPALQKKYQGYFMPFLQEKINLIG